MRKIIVLEHITLDGVIQGPGTTDEDPSDGFDLGGWIEPYGDDSLGALLGAKMNQPFDLLLGRKTYDIWAPYWPHQDPGWPQANAATKYVASRTLAEGPWAPTVILGDDLVERLAAIKAGRGPDLHVWGSSELVQTLLAHDLVDELFLMVYPITLGRGKRLFGRGTVPRAFRPTQSTTTPRGVVVTRYRRDNAGDGPQG